MQIHKILLIQTAFIGDVILASSLVEKLKQYYPHVHIAFLLRKGNEGLFRDHPFISKVLTWDKQKNKYSNLLKLIAVVREDKYDVVINLQRFAAMGLLAALSGADHIIGFTKSPFSLIFTKRFAHEVDKNLHEIERNHQLIKHLTDGTPAKPRLYPNTIDYKTIEAYQGNTYICIAPTSVWYTKQFPKEKWIELINLIPEQYQIYLLGAPSDTNSCQQIIDACTHKRIVNLAGKLSLLASAALMQQAIINYVNDSAPMHLASAINAPTCAVYCSTIPGFGFGPLAQNSYVVEIPYPLYCRPCGLHGYKACPQKHFKCAYDIEVKQLINILYKTTGYKQI